MKIIHCLNHFLPQQVAGTEIYVDALIQGLFSLGIESVVAIPNFGKEHAETYLFNNYPVISYAEPSVADRQMLSGKTAPLGIKEFLRILDDQRPDIVHFHGYSIGTGIGIHHIKAARKRGFKIVTTLHLAGYTCKTNNLMFKDKEVCDGVIRTGKCTQCVYHSKNITGIKRKFLYSMAMFANAIRYNTTNWQNSFGTAIGFPFIIEKLKSDLECLASECDRIVVLAEWYKDILLKNELSVHKINVITQALPPGKTVQKKQRNHSAVLKLIFIGRINYLKGIHLLIDAVRGIPEGNIQLDIYGKLSSSQYETDCRQQAKDLNNISWKGEINPADVMNCIAGHDLLILPSLTEMAPIIIKEAFAAGIPVLASDIKANREQIHDGKNGWLFNFNDSNDLCDKLKMIIDNPRLLSVTKNEFPEVRTFIQMAKDYKQLYESILTTAQDI